MSTTAMVSTQDTIKKSIMPEKKSTREIVREEIKRAKELENLEAKYEAGEISSFEYRVQKALLNLPVTEIGQKEPVCFSTTA